MQMSISSNSRKSAAAVFALVELILGVAIQLGGGRENDYVCFSSVALAFLFAVLLAKRTGDGYITLLGLLATVLADTFLVLVLPRRRILAMVFFVCVQACYFLRIAMLESKSERRIHIIVRIALSTVGVILAFAVLGESADALSIISIFYFANLLVNVVFAFLQGRSAWLFAAGLVCFALCDICVGLDVLLSEYIGGGASPLSGLGINLVWLFYVPSQTLIAISAALGISKNNREQKEI